MFITRIQVVALEVASGTGIVSSAVLLSDDLDEIDLEFSETTSGDTVSKGQNNYYGKVNILRTRQTGLITDCCRQFITGDHDRASFFQCRITSRNSSILIPLTGLPALTWSVDGTIVEPVRCQC